MPALRTAKPSQHVIVGIMADREMAIAIGNYIIELQNDLATLIDDRIEADHRRKITSRIAPHEGLSNQRHRLLRAIDDATNSSSLIRALHREFLAH